LGAKITLILGQKELNDGTILFRDMESGNQEIVDFKKIRQELDKRLKNGV
jgi:histidyl-tRNA synthetase